MLTGDTQGHELLLGPGASYIVGRSVSAQLVVPDDSVSRKHVRFYHARGSVWLRDLGSRNGTSVNGRVVGRHRLRDGDRVGIGASLIRVGLAPADQFARRWRSDDSSGRSMSGSIEDIPLPDVLQWLATSRKTGTLKVHGSKNGSLYLREGDVFQAMIAGKEKLDPQKAIVRMLGWSEGMFELDTTLPKNLPEGEIGQSLAQLLMEAARQQDELEHLSSGSELPGKSVTLASPSKTAWRDLQPDQLDLLQRIAGDSEWQNILDGSGMDDLTLTQKVVVLHKAGCVHFD